MLLSHLNAVTPESFKQRMAGRNPFYPVVFLCRVTVGGDTPVAGCDVAGFGRVSAHRWRCASGVEGVRQVTHMVQRQSSVASAVRDESGDGFGHNPALSGAGAPFHQHIQVELLSRQSLQRCLANLPEAAFVDVAQ